MLASGNDIIESFHITDPDHMEVRKIPFFSLLPVCIKKLISDSARRRHASLDHPGQLDIP